MCLYIRQDKDFFVIALRVIPNAKKSEIAGIYDDVLKIRISAPAIEGKANSCIIKFFSDYLNISKSKLEIVSGEKSKCKLLRVYADFSLYKDKFSSINMA